MRPFVEINRRDLKCSVNTKGDSDILVGNDKRKKCAKIIFASAISPITQHQRACRDPGFINMRKNI